MVRPKRDLRRRPAAKTRASGKKKPGSYNHYKAESVVGDKLRRAVVKVRRQSSCSLRATAEKYAIPESKLHRKVQEAKATGSLHLRDVELKTNHRTLLTPEEEMAVEAYIL